MSPRTTHPLVDAYLRDLELLLHGVEPGERAEVLAGVREHLDGSLTPGADDRAVRANRFTRNHSPRNGLAEDSEIDGEQPRRSRQTRRHFRASAG